MADEKTGPGFTPAGFRLGDTYGEVAPGLGCLHEARRVGTDRPALVLEPGDSVAWRPSGPWRVSLSCDPAEDSVNLDILQAPTEAPLPELANLLVLMSSAVERMEEHPRLQAHVARAPAPAPAPEPPADVRGRWSALVPVAAVAAVFLLGLGLGLFTVRTSPTGEDFFAGRVPETSSTSGAPYVLGWASPDAGVISYSMPERPFSNQEPAPCLPRRGEVAIHGGCWIEVAQRPPCLEDTHAEYQGSCYLPVARRIRPSQSVQPAGR